MFGLMIVVFVLGYAAIALEHPLKVNKAATALLVGVLTWTIYIVSSSDILSLGFSPSWLAIQDKASDITNYIVPIFSGEAFEKSSWNEVIELSKSTSHFVGYELEHHLIEIAEILFFLLGAMTIVETVDQHQGFKVLTDRINTTSKVKLLWILSFIGFFMSAVLDNLTTTIVMVALLRKLVDDKQTRWFFASMIVLAANAGGAWSPIGDVTTIMLWVQGQITALPIVKDVFLPSLVCMVAPLSILSFTMKGTISKPKVDEKAKQYTTRKEQVLILCLGVGALLFVPVFKSITHLPPYMGMLFGLGVLWVVTEIMHKNKTDEYKSKLAIFSILRKIDTATILFFLGILTAVASLQSAGHLAILANWLDNATNNNIYVINLAIGILSSVIDNVPLVAGAMGMYPIADGVFAVDGYFWQFLAYCAGTGGSILIIGSAAGVAAMGMEKIDFIWYMKRISLLALVGYLAGAAVYFLQVQFLF